MGMVLSIYSQKGFREVSLPERGQNSLDILIQKELFALDQDICLSLEKGEQAWSLTACDALLLSGGGHNAQQNTIEIRDGLRFEVQTKQGSRITVISFEQTNPFTVYRKYSLSDLHEIKVGRNAGNDIRYLNDFVSGAHASIVLQDGAAKLCDTSKNGVYLNFKRVYGSTILNYGDSIRIMRLNIIYLGNMIAIDECDNLDVRLPELEEDEIQALAAEPHGEGGNKVLYRRSPRNLRKLCTEPFEIEAPPNPPENRDAPLAMTIGPALTMSIPMLLGSAVSVWASRSGGASSGAYMYMGMITAVTSALIGAIWALLNVRYAGKTRKQDENRRFERYSEYLIRMRDDIEKAHRENAGALKERYLSAEECCTLDERSPLLWNRNISFDDFLGVRLGMGAIPFQAEISVPKERFTLINDNLADKPRIIRENFHMLKDVPVTVDLMKHRLLGISGGDNRKAAIAIAKAMIVQMATANCYTDVKIAVVYDGSNDIDRETWDFAAWLPHVWSGDKKIQIGGLFCESIIYRHTEPVTMTRRPAAQPFIVGLATALGILYNGISIFDADGIIEPPHRPPRTEEVPEFSGAVQSGGVPDDMIMNMGFVDVGTDNKSMIALGKAAGQLTAQAVGLLRGDLAGDKGLPYLVGDHITGPALSASFGKVLPLGEKKLRVRDPAVALIAGDKPAAVRLVWIFNVVYDVADCCSHCPTFAGMQRHNARGSDV